MGIYRDRTDVAWGDFVDVVGPFAIRRKGGVYMAVWSTLNIYTVEIHPSRLYWRPEESDSVRRMTRHVNFDTESEYFTNERVEGGQGWFILRNRQKRLTN